MLNTTIHRADVILKNIYTLNNTATTFVEQKLWKSQGDVGRNTLIIGGFHTPLSVSDRLSEQKNK